MPVTFGYPHAKTGSGQAAHLDQVDELNVLQRPGKSSNPHQADGLMKKRLWFPCSCVSIRL
jgi:hypothetical protein